MELTVLVELASDEYSVDVQLNETVIGAMKAIALVSGAINGSNKDFEWEHTPLMIFWQGQKLVKDASVNGYTLAGNISTLTEAPAVNDHVEAYGVY